jgi:hypothetical protein
VLHLTLQGMALAELELKSSQRGTYRITAEDAGKQLLRLVFSPIILASNFSLRLESKTSTAPDIQLGQITTAECFCVTSALLTVIKDTAARGCCSLRMM